MQIVIFGATGRIGQRILQEALTRGHPVTAALRRTSRLGIAHDRLQTVTADVTIADEVARAADGKDAILSAIGPGPSGDPGVIVAAARSFVVALAARPTRLIAVGGAGTLEIRPGVQRLDTPDFPEAYRPSGYAQREALALYRASSLDWSYLDRHRDRTRFAQWRLPDRWRSGTVRSGGAKPHFHGGFRRCAAR